MPFKLKSKANEIPFVENKPGDKTQWPSAKMSNFFPLLISCKADFKLYTNQLKAYGFGVGVG